MSSEIVAKKNPFFNQRFYTTTFEHLFYLHIKTSSSLFSSSSLNFGVPCKGTSVAHWGEAASYFNKLISPVFLNFTPSVNTTSKVYA